MDLFQPMRSTLFCYLATLNFIEFALRRLKLTITIQSNVMWFIRKIDMQFWNAIYVRTFFH